MPRILAQTSRNQSHKRAGNTPLAAAMREIRQRVHVPIISRFSGRAPGERFRPSKNSLRSNSSRAGNLSPGGQILSYCGHLATISNSESLCGSSCQMASVTKGMKGCRSLSESRKMRWSIAERSRRNSSEPPLSITLLSSSMSSANRCQM